MENTVQDEQQKVEEPVIWCYFKACDDNVTVHRIQWNAIKNCITIKHMFDGMSPFR
jgi:hypothetical protein